MGTGTPGSPQWSKVGIRPTRRPMVRGRAGRSRAWGGGCEASRNARRTPSGHCQSYIRSCGKSRAGGPDCVVATRGWGPGRRSGPGTSASGPAPSRDRSGIELAEDPRSLQCKILPGRLYRQGLAGYHNNSRVRLGWKLPAGGGRNEFERPPAVLLPKPHPCLRLNRRHPQPVERPHPHSAEKQLIEVAVKAFELVLEALAAGRLFSVKWLGGVAGCRGSWLSLAAGRLFSVKWLGPFLFRQRPDKRLEHRRFSGEAQVVCPLMFRGQAIS